MSVKRITNTDATEAQVMFAEGQSITEICKTFSQYSRAQWKRVKKRDGWDAARAQFERSLSQVLQERLEQSKDRFSGILTSLIDQLDTKVREGGIKIETTADAERILKALYFHLGGGTEKQHVQVTSSVDWAGLAQQLLTEETHDPELFRRLGDPDVCPNH